MSNHNDEISICLIEPQYPINLGYIARIMKNFGFNKLLIVNSKVNMEEARPFASHAVDLLENAKHIDFDDLNDFDSLIATTAITSQRGLSPRQSIPVSDIRSSVKEMGKKICVILGRDTTGLTNKEMQLIDFIIHIPANSEYPTLNISHALSILLYELTNYELIDRDIANKTEVNRTVEAYSDIVKTLGLPSHKITLVETSFFNILKRSKPSPRENSILLGLAQKIKLHLEKKF
jgi:TrmH family RNA methyltransferase